MRVLATDVFVDGLRYRAGTPESEIPEGGITNPNVWVDAAEREAASMMASTDTVVLVNELRRSGNPEVLEELRSRARKSLPIDNKARAAVEAFTSGHWS